MNIIKENMNWPINNFLTHKMQEYSAWYSGDAEVLANFYNESLTKSFLSLPFNLRDNKSFWGRQIKNQGEIFIHVPIAGDIAETSANFLFGESPKVKVSEVKQQEEADIMLLESGFYRKILEAAETAAAMGGVYIKVCWDEELSKHPIPVVVQADRAIPEFSFGILTAVTFWKTFEYDETKNKVFRLLERYEKGKITNQLYLGNADKLGKLVDLNTIKETELLTDVIQTPDALFAVYIPNILPNRLDRNSCLGRSDFAGIEGLMDSLDEVFSSWVREIALAQGRILLPESYINKNEFGKSSFNLDKMLYVKLDIDPTTDKTITFNQFEIRADAFEKTALNLLDRIITSAGYSPQSFGLNIQGRAESGTALMLRERKSFATKNKKEKYWLLALKQIVKLMLLAYKEELAGKIEADVDVNVSFSDGITNNLNELANSVKLISDAMAASTETKVRLLHTDWSEEQVVAEVKKIVDENGITTEPAANPDLEQMKYFGEKE